MCFWMKWEFYFIRSHRRRAKEIAASLSQGVSASKKDQATTNLTRRTVQCTSVPRIRGQEQVPNVTPVAEMRQKTAMSAGHQRSVEEDAVQALMDLALPRFKKSDDRATSKTRPWPVALSSPTSPASVDGGNRNRSLSHLDVLSSDDSGGGRNSTLLCRHICIIYKIIILIYVH